MNPLGRCGRYCIHPLAGADVLASESAGAGSRLTEPVREDRREDVQARVDADRYEAALDDAGMSIPGGWLLRPGGSWAAKGGLTTLVAYNPADPPDQAGRRESDRCVGMVEDPELAARIAGAYNARRGEPAPDQT